MRQLRVSTRRWTGLFLAVVMFVPAVVSVVMSVIYNALAKQYRAHTPSGLPLPGAPNSQRVEDQARLASAVHGQPAPIHVLEASFHAQASTAHVVASPLHNLAAEPVGHHGSLLAAAPSQHRAWGRAFVVAHGAGTTTALRARPTTVASQRDRLEDQLKALAAQRAQAARLAQQRERQEEAQALQVLAAAKHRQQVQQYLEAAAANAQRERAALQSLAAARHRQQVERFLVAAAAAHRVELARAPTTGHATLPPPPPVTRTAFHTGVVTPPQQPTLPAPVTSVPGQGGLPLPAQYLQNGTVDQGVDYAAPGGTPLFAMGPGTIVRAGMAGFGPNAPVLQIGGGPLAGRAVYYGHAGPNLVPVGARVAQGQQISIVGYGRVGISTGPHLEVGFYPPGPNGSGQAMLHYVNSVVGHNTGR